MAKMRKSTIRLAANHVWKAKPGNQIVVLDRGAVRFDVPRGWLVDPEADTFKMNDAKSPDDTCTLQCTVFKLPPDMNWDGLSLREMFESVTMRQEEGEPPPTGRKGPWMERRGNVELIWHELTDIDKNEQREFRSRMCFARGGLIQIVLTLDFWPEDEARLDKVWTELLRSLRLGEYVKDPRTGQRFGYG